MIKWMVCILLVICCGGCGGEVTEEAQQEIHTVKAAEETDGRTQEERAAVIKERLKGLDEVTGTAVVVEGRTAIIGLRLKNTVEQNEIGAVKKEAEALARGADVSAEHIAVTVNGYVVSLIEETERKRAA